MNQIPEAVSTSGSDLPATSESPQCPPDLLPGSAMERAVNARNYAAQSEGEKRVERVRESTRMAYERIQTSFRTPANSKASLGYLRTYEACLVSASGDRLGNSVLRYTLSHRAEFVQLANACRADAMREYLDDPDSYIQILGDLLPEEFVAEANEHLARRSYQTGDHLTSADDWPVFLERLQQRCGAPISLIRAGIPILDDALGGGLHGRAFLAGHPATGKTTLALDIARRAIGNHSELQVIILSLDIAKDTVYERLLAAEAGVDQRAMRTGRLSSTETEQVREASDRLLRLILPRIRVLEETAFPQDTGFSLEFMRHLVNEYRGNSVLTIIDNFQRLPILNASTDLERDARRLDVICALQRWTASSFHPEGEPFLIISKVPKEAPQTNLTTAHLLGSTDLGSRASSVMFLWPDTNRNQTGDVLPMTLAITKARDGGICTQFPMQFDHRHCRFVQIDSQKPSPGARARKRQEADAHQLDPLAGS